MGKLRVLCSKGDRTVVWDQKQAETGDEEAAKAVREVERILEEELKRGATAFRVERGVPSRKLERFDPEAEQIVVLPRVVGG